MYACSVMSNSLQLRGCKAHKAPLSVKFSRQEYWSELPFPPPADLSDLRIESLSLAFPALVGRLFTTSASWEVLQKLLLSISCTSIRKKHISLLSHITVLVICCLFKWFLYSSLFIELWWYSDVHYSPHNSGWSRMASACSGLEQGFGSQPEIDVESWQWKHWILASRLLVIDKALALQFCRKEFSQRWKLVKQVKVFIRRKKNTVYVDRHMGGYRERTMPLW